MIFITILKKRLAGYELELVKDGGHALLLTVYAFRRNNQEVPDSRLKLWILPERKIFMSSISITAVESCLLKAHRDRAWRNETKEGASA